MQKTLSLLFAATLLLGATSLSAQIPETLPIQGQLFQNDGTPLVNGSYEVTVRLHTNPDSSGTVMCDKCSVQFIDGVFQVVIGRPGMPALPRFDKAYWVSIAVNGEELSPLIEIHPVAQAHEAAHVVQQRQPAVPIGSILPFAGTLSDESDFMVADGRALLSANYPELFAAIGTLWGDASDDDTDATDFNLPDLRGVFLRGDDMGTGRDAEFNGRSFPSGKVDSSSTVGSYQNVEKFRVKQEFGPVQRGVRLEGQDPQFQDRWYTKRKFDETNLAPPNAAVVYIIRWR